jgi:cytoskeletal protein RodZ
VAQVSQLTQLEEAIITGIEGDDFAACGGDVYARGDIRSIARAVGADPGPLIEEYEAARPRRLLAGEVTEPLPPLRIPPHPRAEPVTATESRQRRPPGEPVMPIGRHQRRRRRPAWAMALGVAVVAGLGFAGYLLASPGRGAAPSAGAHPATSHPAGGASHAASPAATATGSTPGTSAPTAAAPVAVASRPLTPASAAAFGSAGGPGDNSDLARLAIDGNPATAWHTDWYTTAKFGNLYPGTGLLVDMGRPVTITAARITLGPARGASFQLRVGAAPALARLRPVAHVANAAGVVRLQLTAPAHGHYVLIWFTGLPPNPAGTFQAKVYGLQLQGRA